VKSYSVKDVHPTCLTDLELEEFVLLDAQTSFSSERSQISESSCFYVLSQILRTVSLNKLFIVLVHPVLNLFICIEEKNPMCSFSTWKTVLKVLNEQRIVCIYQLWLLYSGYGYKYKSVWYLE